MALACGQLERAEQMFQQAYALARSFDHSPCWESATARGLGLVAAAHGAVDRAVTWLEDAYGRLDRESATYQWGRCNALDSLCDVGVENSVPGTADWLAELEEQAGRFQMHGFLVRAYQHRDRLGQAGANTTAALLGAGGDATRWRSPGAGMERVRVLHGVDRGVPVPD